jgi:hypothetical protein
MVKILASALERVEACPASAMLSLQFKQEIPSDFKDAKRGIAMHEAVEVLLKCGAIPAGWEPKNGEQLTPADMIYVQAAADWVHQFTDQVKCEDWHPATMLCSKICIDAWGVYDDTLHVFDFKFGYTPVDVVKNKQLQLYALVLINQLKLKIKKVALHIVQPTSAGNRFNTWYPTQQELRDFNDWLREVINNADDDQAKAVPGSHCKYCPARASCPSARTSVYAAIDYAMEPYDVQPITNAEIAEHLHAITHAQEMIKLKQTALEAMAKHKIEAGESIPGWSLQPGRGSRDWAHTPEFLSTIFGDQIYAPREVLSPAGVEKLGFKVEALTFKKPGALSLKPIDELVAAQAIFNQPE